MDGSNFFTSFCFVLDHFLPVSTKMVVIHKVGWIPGNPVSYTHLTLPTIYSV